MKFKKSKSNWRGQSERPFNKKHKITEFYVCTWDVKFLTLPIKKK